MQFFDRLHSTHQKSNLPSHCLVLKINQWRFFFSQIGIVLLRSRSQFRSPTAIFSAWRTINRLAVCSKDFKSPLWDVQWTKLSLKKWKIYFSLHPNNIKKVIWVDFTTQKVYLGSKFSSFHFLEWLLLTVTWLRIRSYCVCLSFNK